MITTVQAMMMVARRLTWTPMTSRRLVSMTSGMSARGMPKESTTWLSTSTLVGLRPTAPPNAIGGNACGHDGSGPRLSEAGGFGRAQVRARSRPGSSGNERSGRDGMM